jgi:hypothetical protein
MGVNYKCYERKPENADIMGQVIGCRGENVPKTIVLNRYTVCSVCVETITINI